MSVLFGIFCGFMAWFLLNYLLAGLYTVDQNERAVKTVFGRAERLEGKTTLDDPEMTATLNADEADRISSGHGSAFIKFRSRRRASTSRSIRRRPTRIAAARSWRR